MNACEGIDVPAGFAAAVFSLGELLTVSIVKAARGPVPLLWSAEGCIRLRSVGRISVSPVGQCSVKVESNGKAAAVPVILSDEELTLIAALGWARFIDAATGVALEPAAVLAASLASASCAPTTARLRRVAFLDLWAKGYRMTSGIKFGVDWLTYRGDPTSCHAAFMVTVLPAGAPVAPLELIARSRVATTALKICAFAYVQLPPGGDAAAAAPSVSYQAFRRMGVGAVLIDPTAQTTADTLRASAGLGAALAAFGMSLEPTVVPPPPAVVAAIAAAAAARAVLQVASAAAEADGVGAADAAQEEEGAGAEATAAVDDSADGGEADVAMVAT